MTSMLLALSLLSGAASSPALGSRKTACGITIGVPVRWLVRRVPNASECELQLVRPLKEQAPTDRGKCALRVRVRAGDGKVACEAWGVCEIAEGWYFDGDYHERNFAHVRQGRSGLIVSGSRDVAVYSEDGVRAAGSALEALIIGSRQIVDIDTRDGTDFDNEEVFDAVVASVRLAK
jgi:hypothetical protein